MADIEMPDFDSMSPDEIQLWMESLAKRQGATEGLTTNADMDVQVIDPDSVVIDEPGYTPSETFKSRDEKIARAAAAAVQSTPEPAMPARPEPMLPAAVQPPPAQVAPAAPAGTLNPRGTGDRVRLPTQRPEPVQYKASDSGRITADLPIPPAPPVTPPIPPAPEPSIQAGGALAWLESLAAGQGGDFDLDFSALSSELPASSSAEPAIARETSNPESWLDSLVSSGGELTMDQAPTDSSVPTARAASYDEAPSWLESLTGANDFDEMPATQDDMPISVSTGDDPADWLRSLSASEGYDESGVTAVRSMPSSFDDDEQYQYEDDDAIAMPAALAGLSGIEVDDDTLRDIERAISEGRVSSDQMQLWLDHQTNVAVAQPEISLDDFYDPDAPPVPADLPDWLLESVAPPMTEVPASVGASDLFEDMTFDAPIPAATSDMPDWLRQDMGEEQPSVDFDSIFADTDDEDSQTLETITPSFEIEYDPNDTWAEAFDLEQSGAGDDLNQEPDWYNRNVTDPERIAAVEAMVQGNQTLFNAALPAENELQQGQPTAMPAWMRAEAPVETELTAEADMPDWLREAAEADISDMPAWMVETDGYQAPAPEPIVMTPEPVAPAPMPVRMTVAAPIAPPPTPRPLLVEIPADAKVALQQARDYARGDDLAGGLSLYEGLIRKSSALEDVVGDLESLIRIHQNNPAVFRLLGDGLMRQGKLQQALDTYRQALNQL